MGTVIKRRRRDGSLAYSAQISLMRDGKIVHRESRTFNDRKMASMWVERREKELAKPGGLDAAQAGSARLSEAIERYVTTSRKKIGKTKAQVLEALKAMPIAEMECREIESHHIVALAEKLIDGRQPQTVMNYLSHLQAVFAIADAAWDYPLSPDAMTAAMRVCKRQGLVGKSRQRDRRPTLDELDAILSHFEARERRRPMVPMVKIVLFALFSTRRQEEITRIAWADLDEASKRILVRDMKNPGDKAGNDVWCDIPDEAMRIIQSMPRGKETIFPASTDAISANFTRACKLLKIEDLTFHDLRHEGVSRLFEMGWDIPHAALVSGHRSWSSLKRYAHIKQHGDKYANWKWLPA